MENPQHSLKPYASHLEYFGYTCEFLEDGAAFKAEHEGYGRIFVRRMGRIFLHSNYWFIAEHASDSDVELLKIVNLLNQSNYVSTYSIMEDGGLRIDAVFAGEYSQPSYGEFIDDFHQDIVRIIRNNEELRNYRNQEKTSLVN